MSKDPRDVRRRGRPALGPGIGRSPPVHVRMPAAVFDATYRRAARERRSMPDLMRRAVARYLRSTDRDEDED